MRNVPQNYRPAPETFEIVYAPGRRTHACAETGRTVCGHDVSRMRLVETTASWDQHVNCGTCIHHLDVTYGLRAYVGARKADDSGEAGTTPRDENLRRHGYRWQLLDPQGKLVTVDEAFRRIAKLERTTADDPFWGSPPDTATGAPF